MFILFLAQLLLHILLGRPVCLLQLVNGRLLVVLHVAVKALLVHIARVSAPGYNKMFGGFKPALRAFPVNNFNILASFAVRGQLSKKWDSIYFV